MADTAETTETGMDVVPSVTKFSSFVYGYSGNDLNDFEIGGSSYGGAQSAGIVGGSGLFHGLGGLSKGGIGSFDGLW